MKDGDIPFNVPLPKIKCVRVITGGGMYKIELEPGVIDRIKDVDSMSGFQGIICYLNNQVVRVLKNVPVDIELEGGN